MSTKVRFGFIFGFTLFLGAWAGCGAGDYKQRVDARVERLQTESAFQDLGQPVALGDTRVSVRIPKIFGDPPQPCTKVSRIEVPGLKVTDPAAFGYETTLPVGDDDAAGKASCALRFWVRPGRGADFSSQIATWLRDTFPGASQKAQEVDLRTERGDESTWSVMAAEGEDAYLVSVGGQEESQQHDGRTMAYMFKTPDETLQVLMTLRAPKSLWEKHDLKKLADQTAGSVTVKPADAP